MRRFISTAFLFLTIAGSVLASAPVSPPPTPGSTLLSGQRVLVLGDSITQDGRYVSYLEYYLRAAAPQSARCDLISIGLGSETVSGLSEKSHPYPRPCVFERLDRALNEVKPQVVLACYGMNDGIYHPPSPERRVAFTTGLHQLIEKVRATGASLVLITPPVFDALPIAAKVVPATAKDFGFGSPYAGYDAALAEFAAIEVELKESGVTVIDLHSAMTGALAVSRQHNPTFTFAKDGVHPGDLGHLLMARVIAGGLGLVLGPVNPDSELARLAKDPVFNLVRARRELRSEAWLPFVGYTRGATFKSASVKATELVAAGLQSDIEAVAAK